MLSLACQLYHIIQLHILQYYVTILDSAARYTVNLTFGGKLTMKSIATLEPTNGNSLALFKHYYRRVKHLHWFFTQPVNLSKLMDWILR